jgi:hypothetical protein
MNVIGIIQTDLNEFSVLFDQEDGQRQGNQGDQGSQNHNQNGSDGNDSMFLNFLDEEMGQDNGGGNQSQNSNQNQQQNQNGPQEMTVRIKGIPEGQKANFLQMYQILQDAKDVQSLANSLTIVQTGDGQSGQGQGGGQKQLAQQDKTAKKSR